MSKVQQGKAIAVITHNVGVLEIIIPSKAPTIVQEMKRIHPELGFKQGIK